MMVVFLEACENNVRDGFTLAQTAADKVQVPNPCQGHTNWQLQRVDQFYNGPSIMGLFRPTMMVRALGATNYHRHDADAVAWPCK